jgi:tripartite motif-containing protein 71
MRRARAFFVVCAGLLCQLPQAASAQAPPYLTQWGAYGSGNGQFNYPEGVAVDAGSDVYVADNANERIQKFTADGTYVTGWGTLGALVVGDYPGGVVGSAPQGVAVDGSGRVYVVNQSTSNLMVFTSSGTYVTSWGGQAHFGDGQFQGPVGVAVDGSGNVYVADTNNHRIQKFTSDGAYLTQWGTYGTGDGQFASPRGVTADGSGNVYVADSYNHRVQVFTSSGTYLTQWGTYGPGNGQFNSPWGIAVDASGDVYVADTHNHRIQVFTSDGVYLTQWGVFGYGPGEFNYPSGIAVDRSGNLYVCDAVNHRIQVFGPLPTPTKSTSWGRIKALYR